MVLRITKIIAWPLCLIFLIGLTFSGYSDVLCISEDGQMELETLSLPCCDETGDFCEYNTSEEQHNKHNNCSSCLDVEHNNPLWTKRPQKTDFSQLIKLTFASSIDAVYSLTSIAQNNLRIIEYSQLYNQNPPSLFLTTTILRC